MKRMPLFLTIILSFVACMGVLPAPAATSVNHIKGKIAGTWVNVVTIDLNAAGIMVTPAISRRGIGTSESFRSMMRRTRPAAAINGTFFDTRTLLPTGDIAIDGTLIYKGYLGTAIGVDCDNKVTLVPSRRRDLYKWSNFEHVLVAGPTLVLRGKTIVQPRREGFRSCVHFTPHIRSAIGLTYQNKLVLVTTRRSIYLGQLARVMKTLKCVDAAVLDGGSSSGLYCRGKLIKNPSRGMTNCLLVYDNPASYDKHRASFYPSYRYSSKKYFGS